MSSSSTNNGSSNANAVPVPSGYVCPITNDIMVDPVIDTDGNSYERVAILEWLNLNKESPITRKPLDPASLVPNRSLREAIELFKTNNPMYGLPTSLHPPVAGAEASSAPASASASGGSAAAANDQLQVNVLRNEDFIWASVKAAAEVEPTTQTSSDICCVVDTSGSMGCEVQIKTSGGVNESFGITQLDLVKHAMKTIIECLTDRDRLALVSFCHVGKTIFDLTVMDAAGKSFAKLKLEELEADGSTNIWDGMVKGLDLLACSKGCNRNCSLFLLTDGVPNVSPPKGNVAMLRQYIDGKDGVLGCTINTFGFGYSLDSTLLEDLAFEGNGSYAFIPDGSFVGTIFINAMSNFLSAVAKDVTLTIEGPVAVDDGASTGGDSTAQYLMDASLMKHLKHEVTSWGIVYHFGSVIYGQSKDILIPIRRNPAFVSTTDTAAAAPYCHYSLKYTKVVTNTVADTEGVSSVPCFLVDNANRGEFKQHFMRLQSVNTIFEGMKAGKRGDDAEVKHLLKQWKQCYKEYGPPSSPSMVARLAQMALPGATSATPKPATSPSDISQKFLPALEEDITGQVAEALSTQAFYKKWGRHYLPSLARAHLYQSCNNFKDPGVQFYGGRLFDQLRDRLHDIFCKLPPPTPSAASRQSYGINSRSSTCGGGQSRLSSMSVFNHHNNPCFHEDCRILLSHPNSQSPSSKAATKAVRDVVAGDAVLTEGGRTATVQYVLKTLCPDGQMTLVHFPKTDLKVTRYHPMKVPQESADGTRSGGSRWAFPTEVNENASVMPCGAIYSFVLAEEDCYSVSINDTWCATLGHGFTGSASADALPEQNRNSTSSSDNIELLNHPYFGSRSAVVGDLKRLQHVQQQQVPEGCACSGVVTITSEYVVRDPVSGLICGITAPEM